LLTGVAACAPGVVVEYTAAAALVASSVLWLEAWLVMAMVRRMPALDRVGWFLVGAAISLVASARLLELLAGYLSLTLLPAVDLGIASFIGLGVALTWCFLPSDRAHRGVRMLQGVLDYATLLSCGVVLLSIGAPHSVLSIPPGAPGWESVLADSLVLLAYPLLLIARARILRAIHWCFWLAALLRIGVLSIDLFGPRWAADTVVQAVLMYSETLRYSLLALAALRWLQRSPQRPPQADAPLHLASPVPTIVLALTMGVTLLPQAALTLGAASIVCIGVLRALLIALRRHALFRRLAQERQQEKRAWARQARASDELRDRLARLIHDQAAPLHGLVRIQRELEDAQITVLSDRIASQLSVLEALAHEQRATLLRPATTPSGRPLRTVDALIIVRTALDAAAERARLGGVQLSQVMSARDTLVRTDAIALRRILDNLITNALDATPSGGQIVVELWHERLCPGTLTLTVRDSGCGLSVEEQTQIFAITQHKRSGPGMGLGLAIVRELATSMGGSYGVQSAPGAGSSFWVRLALAERVHVGGSPPMV
jgi:signal transduction histidine kinase